MRLPLLAAIMTAAGAIALGAATPAFAVGMPQLDASNPLLWWQLVWGAVIFVVLYVLLSRSALPKVAGVLATRAARIESDLDAARDAKREADEAGRTMHEERRRAAAEAQDLVAKTVAEAREFAAATLRELNAKLDAEADAAEARLAAARDAALASLPGVAVSTATALVEKLTGRAPEPARIESAVSAHLPSKAA
ncbi:F0F1 ATP synthase subunit B family protein [Endobacter medicaginis]